MSYFCVTLRSVSNENTPTARSKRAEAAWRRGQVLRIGDAIRHTRGRMSAQRLSDATAELGERVERSTITDIENGRRKYVAVHEISLIALALGVTPAALLTFGSLPDGEVEFAPKRVTNAYEVARWWGGEPLSYTSSLGLPPADSTSAALFAAANSRRNIEEGISFYLENGNYPAVLAELREKLVVVESQIADAGGVLSDATLLKVRKWQLEHTVRALEVAIKGDEESEKGTLSA